MSTEKQQKQSRRDLFAAAALQGLLASGLPQSENTPPAELVDVAMKMADAMLETDNG
jgi:hypothetical protein